MPRQLALPLDLPQSFAGEVLPDASNAEAMAWLRRVDTWPFHRLALFGPAGVGKSTLAANLAIALHKAGRRVGLVDADIYGPSQPRLMNVEGTRPTAKDKVLDPVPTPYGVPLLSMGQLVEPGKAIAWRGPITPGAAGTRFRRLITVFFIELGRCVPCNLKYKPR